MNHSLVTADRTTHLKIVAVSLVAAIAVVLVGITARVTDTGASQPPGPWPGAQGRQARRRHRPRWEHRSVVYLRVTSASLPSSARRALDFFVRVIPKSMCSITIGDG